MKTKTAAKGKTVQVGQRVTWVGKGKASRCWGWYNKRVTGEVVTAPEVGWDGEVCVTVRIETVDGRPYSELKCPIDLASVQVSNLE
jgi:hypothetical protein